MDPEGSTRLSTRRSTCARALAVASGVLLAGSIGTLRAQGPAPGANVNVVAGTGVNGDWTLQRQNEPSLACSSRNPRHCLAGANDYRTVDIPFPADAGRVTGDAWLGWYTTSDGGITWRTRLVPGFPQDVSPEGLASPLKGYAAGADPVIRTGTNGLFYYTGLVFNREEGGASGIFVSRFIDNNNREGIGDEPIAYLGTSLVDRIGIVSAGGRGRGGAVVAAAQPERRGRGGAPGVTAGAVQSASGTLLVDKPWIAVDVPRAGAQTCTIGGTGTGVPLQTFPGGRVFVVYTTFDGSGSTQRGRIMFSRSLDCGLTWSAPRLISRIPSADVNGDGVATTADTDVVRASYGRSCGQAGFNPDADVINDCTINIYDLSYVSRLVGSPVPAQPRLSQGATLAIHPGTGALQLAWRQFNDGVHPDAIISVRSNDGGTSFTAPLVVAKVGAFDQGSTPTSFRTNGFPTLAMDGTGRAYLAWATRGLAPLQNDAVTGDSRIVIATSTSGTSWTTPQTADNAPPVGHQIMPALAFAQGKLQLIYYDLREDLSQLFGQFIDELPILSGFAELRHTIEVRAAQADPGDAPVFTSFRLTRYQTGSLPGSTQIQQLQFNPPNLPLFRAGTTPFMGDYIDVAPAVPFLRSGTTWTFNTAPAGSPVFHAIWTDNRDVRPPANGDWTAYTPPNPPFERPAMSGFDPTIPVPPCVPGQAGMRNQNVYTTRITEGLLAGALSNSKPLDQTLQRSFPVFAQNNSSIIRTYRLTIANQPVGGDASFQQFSLLTTLDVSVPPRSTAARTVFARSSNPDAQITVNVVEITAPGGAAVPNGQAGTIILNPDPTNPDIENPDIENPDIENPDIENPDIENPDIENSEVYNPDIENPAVRNPDIENPDIENPDIENPDIENVNVTNPSILNPDIENPDIENPDIENPDIENPDIENTDLVNGSLSDTTWTVRNLGNSAASYTIKLALNQPVPEGFKSQLIAHRLYQTPTVLGCALLKQPQTVLLASIPNPRFVTAAELANPDIENPDIENLTIALGPGETARITLRVLDPNRFDAVTFRAAESVAPAVVSQSVNSDDAQVGVTDPPAAGVLTSDAPVPDGSAGGAYNLTLDGVGTGTWTIAGGQLPPGTTLDGSAGTITGTPTEPGTYIVTLRYESTTGLVDFRTITIVVAAGPGADLSISATAPEQVTVGADVVYAITAANLGPEAATNVVVRNILPEGASYVSAVTSQGTCTHANGAVACSLGSLAPSSVATVTLTARITTGGAHVNEASISGGPADPVATNNIVRITTASASSTFGPCAVPCFSGPTAFPAGPGETAFIIERADFNRDGRLDIAFSPASGNAISILLGDGAGGFGAPTVLTTPGPPRGLAARDLNGDTFVDVVAVSSSTAQAWLFAGNGTGGFAAPSTIDIGANGFTVVAGDFNEDGRPDLVVGHDAAAATAIRLLLGNGDGTFQPPNAFPAGAGPHNVIVEDFDRDGHLDVAASNRGTNTVTVLIGDGAGSFPTVHTITVGPAPRVRQVGDLNGDSIPDLVVSDTGAGNVSRSIFLAGVGDGTFAAPVDVGADPQTAFTTSGDLDADGDLDLVASISRGGFTVQINDGTGVFGAPIIFPVPIVNHLLVADVDGDGGLDVLLAGTNPTSRVYVMLNVCDAPPADIEVSVSGTPGPVAEGSTIPYTITLQNQGPNPATGVQLLAFVSSHGQIGSVTADQGTCSELRGIVSCPIGTVPPGGVVTVTTDIRAVAGGELSYLMGATATTSDPNPADNISGISTSVTAASTLLVVTNLNDSGPGSLRQAIIHANADGGPADTIAFAIPGPGPFVIRPVLQSPLPPITQPVIIDGTTQPGYDGVPIVEISGENTGNGSGLVLNSSGSTIRGLAITRFAGSGILVNGAGNVLEGNYIGTNAAGTPNAGNVLQGVGLSGGGNFVGGPGPAFRNVISGNVGAGILVFGATATSNVITGNYIGTNAAGTVAIANGTHGIDVQGGATANLIGGTTAGAGNVISGNASTGVRFGGAGTSGNSVFGNFIGTNPAGTAAIPNGLNGIEFGGGATGNTVGGVGAGERNVISGNAGVGVGFFGTAANGGNNLPANFVGTDVTGAAPLGNQGSGVYIETSNNVIGSLTSTAGNTIAFNGFVGVRVDSGTGNAIVSNSIHSNASLGIDLFPLGVTPNDPGDADIGPNTLLNTPVFTSAILSAGVVRIQGTLGPFAQGPFQVHFFANTACDPSGSGEGQRLLGILTAVNASTGDTAIDSSFGGAVVAGGEFITGTLTDSGNNTSEFSPCVAVTVADDTQADVAVSKSDSPDPVTVFSPLAYTVTVTNNGPDQANGVTLVDTLPGGASFSSAIPSQGTCTGTGPVTCSLGALASGAVATISIVVVPTAPGSIVNTATVSSATADPSSANNTATATTTVLNVAQTFTVTTTADSGPGSLRAAILAANADPATADVIAINIDGTPPFTIAPTAPLPAVTGAVRIDATTQPDFFGQRAIQLSGAGAGDGAHGFVLNGNDITIRGFIINGFDGSGILVSAGTGARIEGNLIGTDVSGITAVPNGTGVSIFTSGAEVGGLTEAQRNVISGNTGSGLTIQGASSAGNLVHNNFIGTDITGTAAIPNEGIQSGVFILNAPNNRIGGLFAGVGNVVSGNAVHAITIVGADATGNLVQANLVGTAADGTTPLGNGGIGVDIVSAPGNTVGGSGAARNVIANNGLGMQIRTGADNNIVRNNLIEANGGLAVRIEDASGNAIGGLNTGEGNVVRNNGVGVVVLGTTSAGNAIHGNSISGNAAAGIDLGLDGVTANDPADTDDGPNGLQNFPVITSAEANGASTTVQGTLSSLPGTLFRIELFASSTCDPSGHGEGEVRLGLTLVTTDGAGNGTFSTSVAPGTGFLTATASDLAGNTSEFSACVAITLPDDTQADLAIAKADSPDPVPVGSPLAYGIAVTNNGPDAAGGVTVVDTLPAGVTFVSAASSQGTCTGTGPITCSLGSLASGAVATISILVTPNVPGSITNTATVSSTTADPAAGNNTASTTTTVQNVAQTFIVTTSADSGAGSLREAIAAANADPVTADTIAFNLAAPFSIAPASPLPALNGPVTIDGTTQPGFEGLPIVELNGANAGASASGLVLNSTGSIVRGLIINRFAGNGVMLQGGGVHRVDGCWIGITADGAGVAGNANGIVVSSSGNVIGGTTPAARNVVSGNTISGVQISVPTATANIVSGNFIGTDPTGTIDLGNLQAGVLVFGQANLIGGLTAAARNVISGNDQAGVRLVGIASANLVQGNFVGTDVGGASAVPNGFGIQVGLSTTTSASSNTIGGLDAGAGNLIAFNLDSGVTVGPASTNNGIHQNSIHSNGGIGIDLGQDGVTDNDPDDDADAGANDLTNFPVLQAAAGGVTGLLQSTPDSNFLIEYFGNASCDPSGHGEGRTYLGAAQVVTDGAGTASLPSFDAGPGQFITATATDGSENTSEFSACVLVDATPTLTLSPSSAPQGATLDVTLTGANTAFAAGATTVSWGPGITVNSFTVTSAASATASISVSAIAATGTRTVTVTTGADSVSADFTVLAGSAAIASVVPSSGRQAENLTGVVVTGIGTHFATGSTLFSFGGGITVTSATITGPTSATLDLSIAAGAAVGPRDVTATTQGEVAVLTGGFSVLAGVPAVSTVTPAAGRQAQTLDVTVVGQLTSFASGSTAASFGSGIAINSVTVTDATHATVNLTISPSAALGSRTVVMTTGAEIAQQVGGFTVTAGEPTLFSINPSSAVQGTNATIILNGAFTNFTPGVTTASFGSGISVGTTTVNGPTLASVPITISAAALAGPRSVTVTTGSEVVSLVNGFTVLQGTPSITSIDPNAGQRGLTRNVTLSGVFTSWTPGVTAASFGDGVTVNSNVVNATTSLTVNISIDEGAILGPRDVAVSTGAEVLTVPGGFVITDVDNTSPLTLRTSPAHGATGVPLNAAITAEFNEPLDRASVTPSGFQLYDSVLGQFVNGTVTLDATGRVATLVPAQLLAVNRSYGISLNNAITDVAGNPLGSSFPSFTTGFTTDTTGPTLSQANPQSGDSGVGRNVRIVLQFDRPINAATIGIGIRIRTGGIDVPGTFQLEDGQRRLRFQPASQLAAGADYTVTLSADLRDLAGNALTNPGAFVFTTGPDNDTTVPVVTAHTPYYDQSGVGRSPVIRVAYSERVNPIAINPETFYLVNNGTGGLVRATITIAPDRRSATLTPDAPLEPFTYYYFFSSFTDIVGNFGAVGFVLFRTAGDQDTVPPGLVSIDPADGATNVPVNARVRAVLSEPIDATLIPSSAIQLTPAAPGAVTLSSDRLSLLFTPSAALSVSTTYTVQIGGLRDASGNVMAPVSRTFTTRDSSTPDTTAPTVVGFSPAQGSTNVPVATAIAMTVSEPIRTSGIAGSMRVFANIPGYGFAQLAGTHIFNATATVVTFTPTVPYPADTDILVYSNYDSSAADLAGNLLQNVTSTFRTAPVADTTPPTVLMVTPSEGAAGVGPQAVVTLTFSEPLHPATVNNDTFTLFAGPAEISPSISRSADNRVVFLTASSLPFSSIITVVATSDVTDLSGNPLEDFSSTFTVGSAIETTGPRVVTQRPTGSAIPAATGITLFVNKPLDPATVEGAFYVSQNGVLVEGLISVSGGGTALHFDPAASFAPGALVQVFLTPSARDTFGNPLVTYSGSFTVAPDPTVLAPTIVRSSPVFFSFGNPTNAVVDVEFSEPLSPATVTTASVFVVDALGLPVPGTVELRSGDRVVRFTPDAPFAADNYNFVHLTNGLRDLQNVPFTGTNFYFYAGATADTTAPQIQSVAPTDGAPDIGTNATIRLYLDESVNPLTLATATTSLAGPDPIPAGVTFDAANRVVTVVPHVPLPGLATITLTIGGIEDLAGNAVPARILQFTTRAGADTVPPSVIATNVTAYGTSNVPTDAVFEITFDEPVDAATALMHTPTFLYDAIRGYLPGTGTLSSDGRTYRFVPAAPLAVGRQHSLGMFGALDLTGNLQIGFTTFFTTTFAPDATPPEVSAVNPVAGSTGVPRNARVELRFSESIDAQSLGNVRLLTNGGTSVSVTKTLSNDNRIVTLRPSSLLSSNRAYTVSAANVRDVTGNVMAGTFTSTFSTGSKTDLVAPAIVSTNPVANDRGVGLNLVARMAFSEPIDPLSITADGFRLIHQNGGTPLQAAIAVAADRRSATLIPSAPLLPFTLYHLQLFSFTDVAGNQGAGVSIAFYTGAQADVVPPTVQSLAPPAGRTGLPVNTRITAVMSEAIDPTSVSNASVQLTPAVPGVVSLAADRVTITFVPSANLAPSTTYSIQIGGLRDASANTMAPFASSFTTAASAAADTLPPAVIARAPEHLATGIGVTAALTFTTSEPITAAAVGPASVPVYASVAGGSFVQVAGTYSVDATGTIVTFTIIGAFPANATVQWYTNANGSIRDMAGLALPNQLAQFTTGSTPDVTGPVVQAVTPVDGATGVGHFTLVSLIFSESINPATVTANTVALFAGPTRLSTSVGFSLDNRMVILGATLPPDATITVIATGGVADLSENPLAPFSSTFATMAEFDTSHPRVITQRPIGGGVSRTTPITLFLDQPVDQSTIPGALYVSENGVLVTGSLAIDGSSRAITFAPDGPLAPLALVEIFLTSAARDATGNPVQPHYGVFTVENDPAVTAPTLSRTSPVLFSTGNPRNAVVDLEFSEPLDPLTVTPDSVFVRNSSNLPVAGTLSLRSGNRIVRFTAAAPFAPNDYNFVHFTAALRDLQGNAVAGSSFYFYTHDLADTTAPAVSAIVPSAMSGVGVNASMRVTFSERINPLSITPESVTVTANGGPLGTTFLFDSNQVLLTVSPQRPLPPGAQITVTVNGVEDVAGNPIASAVGSFTTGSAPDTVPPVAIAASRVYGDTNVPVNSVFQWTYSEPIDFTTVLAQQQFVLFDHTAGYVTGGTLSISPDARTVTYVPPAALTPGRAYTLGTSSVADLAGNVGGTFTLFFVTSSATDTTPPEVVAGTPADGFTGVPLNARIRIAFDEPVSATSLAGIGVLVGGTPLPVSSTTLSDGDRVVTLTLGGLLAPGTLHTLSIAGVRDRAGNVMAAPVLATFTTGSGVDLVALSSTLAVFPPGGATGVPLDVAPTVTFSEAIDPASVLYAGASGVSLQVAATNVVIPVDYSFSADRRSMTLTPVAPLASGTQYYIRVWSAVTDLAGQPYPTFSQFLFTTQP